MARFNFRTLLNDQTYGQGFFEYPDHLGTAPGTTVYNNSVTAFGYSDPEVGQFGLENLNNFHFTIGTTPTTSAFNIVMSTPDRLKSVTAGPAQPGVLGPTAGKPIKLEWPQLAQEPVVLPIRNPEPPPICVNPDPVIESVPEPIIVPPVLPPVLPPIEQPPIPEVLPPTSYESCMSDCFAKMGRETRCFVLETVKTEINNLIDNSHFDIKQLTVILNELREALDGDDEAAGLNAYFKLVNDVKFLMENYSNQQNIVNTFNNTALHHNHIQQLINNQTFINELLNNQDLIKNLINNTITKIINYLILDDSTDGDIKNSLINALNQLIIKQIAQVKNELNLTINNVRDSVNNQIQQINIQIANLNGNLTNNTNSFINKFELNNLQIQIDALKDAIKNINGLEINPNIDLSKNVTITNIFTQLSQITNNLNAINNNFKQYISRQDLAKACQTACNAFLTALRDPTPCKPTTPTTPPNKPVTPPSEPETPPEQPPVLPPIPVRPGAEIAGDPHFVGAEGDRYDVQGEAGKTYNLLSDKGLQVNGTFGEWHVDGDGTIIKEVGITYASDFIKIGLLGALEINDVAYPADGTYLNGAVTKAGGNITFKSTEYELLITDNERQGHHYINISFKSDNVVADGVLPHGLWGQTADGDGQIRDGDKGFQAQGGGAIEDANGNITQVGDKQTIQAYEVAGLRDTAFTTHNRFSGKNKGKKK